MIQSFTHKGLEKFFYGGSTKGIQNKHVKKLALVLDQLDAAVSPEDMRFPGSGFHRLKGKLKVFYSVRVSGNWRVIFKFEKGHAWQVDYVDYH